MEKGGRREWKKVVGGSGKGWWEGVEKGGGREWKRVVGGNGKG